jgi:hypothetical protein
VDGKHLFDVAPWMYSDIDSYLLLEGDGASVPLLRMVGGHLLATADTPSHAPEQPVSVPTPAITSNLFHTGPTCPRSGGGQTCRRYRQSPT